MRVRVRHGLNATFIARRSRTELEVAARAGAGHHRPGAAGLLTPTLTTLATIAERHQPPAYGAMYALYNLACAAGLAVAPLVAGLIDDTTGFRTAAIGGAAVPTLAGALLLRPRPQVAADTHPTHDR